MVNMEDANHILAASDFSVLALGAHATTVTHVIACVIAWPNTYTRVKTNIQNHILTITRMRDCGVSIQVHTPASTKIFGGRHRMPRARSPGLKSAFRKATETSSEATCKPCMAACRSKTLSEVTSTCSVYVSESPACLWMKLPQMTALARHLVGFFTQTAIPGKS